MAARRGREGEGWAEPVCRQRGVGGVSLFVLFLLCTAYADTDSGDHPGKCRITDDHAHVGWGGGEVWIRPFYILAYNNATQR
jgi:hypothetical protein